MRLLDLIRRRREYDDLAAEIRTHIEERTDALVAGGMDRRTATREARRAFGNVGRIEEEGRDVWSAPTFDALSSDVRHAFRAVRRHRTYAATLIAVAALGVAACATTFALISGVLLAPFGFPGADRVYEMEMRTAGGDYTAAVPLAAYERSGTASPVIEAIGAEYPDRTPVDWGDEPELVAARRVTPSYFRVFGVTPAIGRTFTDDEARAGDRVLLLGENVWRQRFHGDSSVIGRTISLGGEPHTIIGVTPKGFRSFFNVEPMLWLPFDAARERSSFGVNAQVRLKPGVDSAHAAAWLAAAPPTRIASSRGREGDSVAAIPVIVPIAQRIYGDVDRPLWILLAAVLLVLALATTNVATMQLARVTVRGAELDVRRAVGATAARQAQHLIVESIVLCAIGGALGTLIAAWGARAVGTLGITVLPRMDLVALDSRTFAFAAAATLVIGLFGGIAPAILAPRASAPGASTRVTGARTSATLVVAQVALSVMLVVGAGLLLKGFLRVLPDAPGYETRNRASLMVELSDAPEKALDNNAAAARFVIDVTERMRRVRGVSDVATMWFAPMSGLASSTELQVPGQPVPDKPFRAYANGISSNWTEVMRVPVRQGRAFTNGDGAGAPAVALVNETAAKRLWPGQAVVVGRPLTIAGRKRRMVTVVGVVGDTRFLGSDSRMRPQVYFPMTQGDMGLVTFVAATAGPPSLIAKDLQRTIWSVSPKLPISVTADLETTAMSSVRRPRFFAWAVGAFAASAVVLTGLAVYGLLAFSVAQGRREIGIRLAMGATPARVGRRILGRAALLGATGVVIGAAAARGLSRYLESLLIEVSATDAKVFALAAVSVLAIAVVSAVVPAARAVRVDPATSLRL